jgi:hypothetical protein
LFGFSWPQLSDAAMLFSSGVANALAQYLWTKALRLAPAAAVSPFYYFLLVWSLIIGFIAWGDIPGIGLLAGSMIVVACGLFLLWHETGGRPAQIAAWAGWAFSPIWHRLWGRPCPDHAWIPAGCVQAPPRGCCRPHVVLEWRVR